MYASNFYQSVGAGGVPPGTYRVDVWWAGGPATSGGAIGAAFVLKLYASGSSGSSGYHQISLPMTRVGPFWQGTVAASDCGSAQKVISGGYHTSGTAVPNNSIIRSPTAPPPLAAETPAGRFPSTIRTTTSPRPSSTRSAPPCRSSRRIHSAPSRHPRGGAGLTRQPSEEAARRLGESRPPPPPPPSPPATSTPGGPGSGRLASGGRWQRPTVSLFSRWFSKVGKVGSVGGGMGSTVRFVYY